MFRLFLMAFLFFTAPQVFASDFTHVVGRLQELGYLPLTAAQVHTQSGSRLRYNFRFPVPSALQDTADTFPWNAQNPFFRGAVIQFERQNGILGPRGMSEGQLHRQVLRRLFSSTAKPDAWPWQWVLVNKASGTSIPESLHIWEAPYRGKPARWVWRTVVNTGVLGSTPDGTWPIYQRLPVTTMRGVFPVPISWAEYRNLAGSTVPQWVGSPYRMSARGIVNGHPVTWQPYDDTGIRWVNYFDDGRGIHYYPRAAYGFPQSAGCVEEPKSTAKTTYELLHYGVPVTISRSVFRG